MSYYLNTPASVCFTLQDSDAGGIDWGDDVEATPIEIVDMGTDCKLSFSFRLKKSAF